MDALGSFLKTALYRVIFVLIVGIPAVEVFSFALFDNGIMIKKIDSNHPSLNSKVIILAQPDKKHPGITEIPTTNTTSFKNGIALTKIAIISNAETRIDEDPRLLVLPPNTFKIDGNLFSIQSITGSALMLYFIAAFILGEVLCFAGEIIIGLFFFDWRPFSSDNRIEKVVPQAKAEEPEKIIKEISEICKKITQEGEQDTTSIREKMKKICEKLCRSIDVESNKKLYLTYYEVFNDKNPGREASEVHYVLSRILAGIFILSLLTINWWAILIIIILLILWILCLWILCKNQYQYLLILIALIFLIFFWYFPLPWKLGALAIIAATASITYRIEANKIAKYPQEKPENNKNSESSDSSTSFQSESSKEK